MEVKLHSLPHELLSKTETPAPRLRRSGRYSLAYVLATVGTIATLLASCTPASIPSEFRYKAETATAVARGIGGQDGTPYVNPIREATAEAAAGSPPTPEPTATEVVKKEAAPCIITSPELCAQAERIHFIRSNGITETYLVFNPSQKAPFFTPEGIQLLDKVEESGDPFSGFTAILRKPFPGGAYIIIGLEFDNMLQVTDPEKGSLIGYSNSTGIKNLGAKVLVTVTKRTPEGPVTDEDALKTLSPAAYEKPIAGTYSQNGPGIPNVSISYSSKPPQ